MYPIYPLLAVMAAFSLNALLQVASVTASCIGLSQPLVKCLRYAAVSVVMVVCVAVGSARVAASYRNYGGRCSRSVMQLW